MRSFGAFRVRRPSAARRLALRLRDERGIALVMALGVLVVLGISASSIAYYTSAQGRNASSGENRQDSYALAEAGMNAALAVLEKGLNANTATALPACTAPATMTLDGGTASYCGALNTSTYVWSLTSTGTAPNPTGGTPITTTLHRTVTVRGISDGSNTSAWSRFYQDSPTGCLTIDTVSIPGSVAARNCLQLQNGGKITGSNSTVEVGGNVNIVGQAASNSARAAGTGAGWTSSSNILTSNNAYATASVAASGTSANLDATNFGFSIPSGDMIVGINASVERHEATSSGITYDTASSATTALNGVSYDASSSATSATAGTTLSWSHTVANQSNRVLVVGVTAEYTSNACQASSVTFGGQSLTKITQNVAGTSTYECSSLWYVLAPTVSTNTITVTYQSSVTNKSAGAVGLWNVKQAGPDASNSSFSNSGATSTSVTTVAANSWVVDVFASSVALGDLAAGSGQTARWTRDSGSTQSSGMSTKPVAAAGATNITWTQSGITRSAAVVAAFAPAITGTTTLAWSHTVANQSNRVLVVGVTAEHTSNACQASSVTYGGQSLTKITQNATTTTGTYECASLWYLVAPNVGTNTITVTYESSMADESAGAVGLWNVKQAAPDASNSSFNDAGATSTSVTTVADTSWVVDVFGSGQPLGNLAAASGQTARWTQDANSNQSSGMSTKPVATAGATSMTWTQTGINRSAAVVAAFAPATPGDITDTNVVLLKSGAPIGSNHASAAAWGTSDATQSYGSATDLWGTTWTTSEVNASNFGVRLAVRNTSATASNTASVDYVTVTVYYEPVPTSSIGTVSTPVLQANIAGTCTLGAQAAHTPCSSADQVYASTITTAPQDLTKPTIDLAYWWQNAKPGPKHPCTTSSGTVPTFDNNAGTTSTYDRSLTDNGEITPETGSYTCQVWENGQLVGELSWDKTTRVLKVKGTIFRDGNFRFDDDGQVVHYQGRAIIYASGDLEFDEQVCAGGSGTGTCTSYPYPGSTMQTWDPTQNLLILLTNHNSEYDQGGTTCSPTGTATCPNGHPPGAFQGIAYANGDCLIHQDFQLSGPVMCNTITIPYESGGMPSFYTWPPLGSLIDGQIYVSTSSADVFQIDLGPTDG